jgi:hypothetical protein
MTSGDSAVRVMVGPYPDGATLTEARSRLEAAGSRVIRSLVVLGCGQDWPPGLAAPQSRPIDNRPQVGNLPHNSLPTCPTILRRWAAGS